MQPRRQSCARSHSPLFRSRLSSCRPSERALALAGAQITALATVVRTAVSTHSSNARRPCPGSADSASRIRSLVPISAEEGLGTHRRLTELVVTERTANRVSTRRYLDHLVGAHLRRGFGIFIHCHKT